MSGLRSNRAWFLELEAEYSVSHLQFLERSSNRELERILRAKKNTTAGNKGKIRCLACGHILTNEQERQSVDGAHIHTFSNPHGIVYIIACYGDVPGCTYIGSETEHWTWFEGYVWQIALCAGCRIHIGWAFRQSDDRFHGLVRNRLCFDH